jgi:sugar O-acyltransferase (sialic acid O-acetyltransferase NeuD family)
MTVAGLVILGFGGHARSVADVALDCGVERLIFVDAAARPNETWFDFPVLGAMPDLDFKLWAAFPAACESSARRQQVEQINAAKIPVATLISTRAYVGKGGSVGTGAFVAHNSYVGPMAVVGAGAIINTGAIVEHECRVGDFSHVSVNATVAGRCVIGDSVFVGAGAVIKDKVHIADGVIIGAGACVVEDLREQGTYVGVPARKFQR